MDSHTSWPTNANRRPRPLRNQIRPLSRLADPDWASATIAYAKDTVALEEAERKLGAPRKDTDKAGEESAKAKGRGAPKND